MSPLKDLAAAGRNVLNGDRRRAEARSIRRARGVRSLAANGLERLEGRALLTAHAAAGASTAGAVNPKVIEALAAEAYVWGLAPEFTQRFSTYNTTIGAPINTLGYGSVPAAWNNQSTNAGDSSVMYINGFMDFSKTPALVLTVPPSAHQYYVVNYLDDYVNTIGSIGTRTTPSEVSTSYLLVGPNSPYAKMRTANIHGTVYRVMASDTNLNWMLIRVGTNSLADASDPQSVPSIYENVVKKFALNTLKQFEKNGHQPVFPTDYSTPAPTTEEVSRAAPFKNTPTNALGFFKQLGHSVKGNPVPALNTGLSGSLLKRLPSWIVPQYGAKSRYVVPSFGQKGVLRSFASIGLTANGFQVPKNWRAPQLEALQRGFEAGQKGLNTFISSTAATSSTNNWTILNTMIGTYPNNELGYAFRSTIVLNGGSANVPADAVYPNMTSNTDTTPLDGNNTYSITFTPPAASGQTLPANGIYPPLVNDSQGNPRGFWSISLYQPDPSEVSAPFVSQASVLNTAYSSADTAVVSVDTANNLLTVLAPSWGTIVESTPILFGSNAAEYGLLPNTVYYVASTPTSSVDPTTQQTSYTFSVSAQWIQTLSPANVPVQYSGTPGPVVDLQSQAGASPLSYGMVKPVSQLGSAQLTAGQLAKNSDGSLTLWIAPTLPAGVAASNWIPTPSTAYLNTLYPNQGVSTSLQIILRMYDPTPGNSPPSILPYQDGSTKLPETYIPPALVQVG